VEGRGGEEGQESQREGCQIEERGEGEGMDYFDSEKVTHVISCQTPFYLVLFPDYSA